MAQSGTFKVKDRVKKSSGEGCLGTVAEVTYETTGRDDKVREKSPMFVVNWDNGVTSVVGTKSIESAKG